ncbi:MAG TPA: fibronectin type III domain-containing protein, partial [Thermoanaerobaculia bacterium]
IAAIPLPVPVIVATGAGNGSASIAWDAVPGVAGYELFRKDAHGGSWTLVHTTPAATFFSNGGLAAGATYLYRLRTFDAAGNRSADSNLDLATTIDYSDPQLGAGTLVRAQHVIEVRRAVNAICTFAGAAICPAAPFSGASLDAAQVKTQPIRASDFADLTTQLVSLRSAIGAAPATFRGPAVAGNPVSRIQTEDLRAGAK